jgi:16S rRNA (uracil1498-N3)-methyltransferase
VITLLVEAEAFAGQRVEVTGEAYQHLFRARRTAVGEAVRVVDGLGHARWSRVESVDRRRGVLALAEPADANEPPRAVHLLVATPRPQRASWLVEKATEVGVAAIHFLHTERAPRNVGEGSAGRLRRVAAAAVEQCHRARLPEITGPHPFAAIPQRAESCPHRLVLDTGAEAGPLAEEGTAPVALAIGPEGGWSAEELHQLADWGFRAISLGPRILRIETAAVVGVAGLAEVTAPTAPG